MTFNHSTWTARNIMFWVRLIGGPKNVLLVLAAPFVLGLCLLGTVMDINKHIFDTHPVQWKEFKREGPWRTEYEPALQRAVADWEARNR